MAFQKFLSSLQEQVEPQAKAKSSRLKGVSAQFYSLRDFTKTADDLKATLARVAEIGYKSVQFSAVGAMNGESPEVSPEKAREWLDKFGLTCCATHRSWELLRDSTQKEIDFHKALGCDYTATGMAPKSFYDGGPEEWRAWIEETKPVIDTLQENGIRFGFHNHANEFEQKDGERSFEILVAEGHPLMQFEMDTYWVIHAGVDLAPLIEVLDKRLDAVHLKDKEVKGWETRFAPVGEGNMNWSVIIPALLKSGTEWLIIEQDDCFGRDPFDCLESSLNFVNEFLEDNGYSY